MSEVVVTYEIKIPATDLAVSLDDAKAHCRVDYNDDDALITDLIWAACEYFEKQTGYGIGVKTITTYAACDGVGWLPLLPLITELVNPVDSTLPGRIMVNNFQAYAAYPIDMQVGYSAITIPFGMKLAILKMISTAYENREDVEAGSMRTTQQQVQRASEVMGNSGTLIMNYRRRRGI